MRTFKSLLFILACLVLSLPLLAQRLALPALFSDHMVLQCGMEPPVWGTAKPNTSVVITFNGERRMFLADSKGAWMGRLPEPIAGKTYTLLLTNGADKIILQDVIGGDVYYAGGQSNMQYTLTEMPTGKEAIATSANKAIRLFTVPRDISYKPRFDVNKKAGDLPTDGTWLLCAPEAVKDFSAVAYFFARRINKEVGVPVGIINVTWGGTSTLR